MRGKRANSWFYFVVCYFHFYSLARNSLFLLFSYKRVANGLWARESSFFFLLLSGSPPVASQDVGKMHSRLVQFSFGLFLLFDSV